MSDTGADAGRNKFLAVGCDACHSNAGANASSGGGGNRNFNTGVESSRNPALAAFPQDGGFGTISTTPDRLRSAMARSTCHRWSRRPTPARSSTPRRRSSGRPAHNVATATTIEEAIAFYTTAAFRNAPDGFPINLNATQIDQVGRFLRGLNAAFSAAIAIKRIDAELAIIAQFHSTQLAIQTQLIQLANVETNDAVNVLSAVANLDAASVTQFKNASTQLTTALTTADEATRVTALNSARTLLVRGSAGIGTNLGYKIGDGSVMF